MRHKKPDWEPWLAFFLRCLKQQKDRLEAKMERERILAPTLPALSIEIVSLLREHERLTAPELRRLTSANPNTLKVRLRELVTKGYIRRHGQARATWYRLPAANENSV